MPKKKPCYYVVSIFTRAGLKITISDILNPKENDFCFSKWHTKETAEKELLNVSKEYKLRIFDASTDEVISRAEYIKRP